MKLNKKHKILIVGLGLIGGSYAKALKKKGYFVGAVSDKQSDIDFGLKEGIIDDGKVNFDADYIGKFNLIVFALYPKIFTKWIKTYGEYIKPGTVITDVTGVKSVIVDYIQTHIPHGVEFISAHPMAGREVSGVENSDDGIFRDANYIVVPTARNSDGAIELCKDLGYAMGFSNISVLSPEEHDEMIAFLSQLTHCIAVTLMCANDNENLVKYTGDSFRDLTRIAKINENMWCELFMMNKAKLLEEMDAFKSTFDKLYDALLFDDTETMKDMMRLSTKRRKTFEVNKK